MRFQRATWAQARPQLLRALRDGESSVAAEVSVGAAEVWSVDHEDGNALSWLVTRVEGQELVVVAYEGREVLNMARAVVEHATRRGFASIRFHTVGGGLGRMLKQLAPVEVERVMRVKLHGR